jgi:hypothetical protein
VSLSHPVDLEHLEDPECLGSKVPEYLANPVFLGVLEHPVDLEHLEDPGRPGCLNLEFLEDPVCLGCSVLECLGYLNLEYLEDLEDLANPARLEY